MSLTDTLQDKFEDVNPLDEEEDGDAAGRIDIDELSSEEMQNALEYLNAIGRETTRKDIEEAAYYLRNVDDEAELFSAYETGEERGRIDRSLVAPNNMEKEAKWHTRDGDFYQILTTTSLPRLVTPGWMVPITLSEHDARISMHITPRDTSSVKGRLQQRLTQMKSAIQWKKRRGRTDVYEEEHERQELERLLRNVIEGTTKLFNLSFYMEVHGETLEEMEEASRVVQRKVSEQGMDLVPVEGRQIPSQQAMTPVGTDPVKNNNTVQLEALATFFNFVEPPVNQPEGVLVGFDDSKRPVIVDRFSLSGHSKVVTGKIGGGKTYASKLSIYRRLLNDSDVRTIIFDPLGDDFVDFAEKLDGQVIRFGGGDRINPLQIEKPSDDEDAEDLYTTKVRSVIEILKTYFEQSERGGMDAGEEGVITQAAHYAYSKKGITEDPETFDKESPIIDDVIEGIRIIAQGGIKEDSAPGSDAVTDGAMKMDNMMGRTREIIEDPSDQHVKIAQQLVPKFESFKQGSVNNNLNGHTNIELNDRIVCFDMESFADTGEMPLIMHTMLDWAYQEARRSPRRTDITFEEAHYLLNRSGARKLLNLFIRHARHFDAGLTLISQTPDEFLGNDEKKEIYDNCDIKQMFYQENVSSEVIEYFDFSEEEARFLRQAARGQNSDFSECLLSTSEHGRRRLEIYAGPYERHILEEDLDPHGYLEQQGLKTGSNTSDSASFDEDVISHANGAPKPGPADPHGAASSSETPHIDSPSELDSETVQQEEPEVPDEESGESFDDDDPFRVSGDQQQPPSEENAPQEREPQDWPTPDQDDDRSPPKDLTEDIPDAGLGDTQASSDNTTRPQFEDSFPDSGEEDDFTEEDAEDDGDDGIMGNLPLLGGGGEDTESPEDDHLSSGAPPQEPDHGTPEDQPSMVDELLGKETVQWLLKTLPIVILMLLVGTAAIYFLT